MTLQEYLADKVCAGFTPKPVYNRAGDSISTFWKDEYAISEQVNERLTLHYSSKTGEVVGCTVYGVKAMVAGRGE